MSTQKPVCRKLCRQPLSNPLPRRASLSRRLVPPTCLAGLSRHSVLAAAEASSEGGSVLAAAEASSVGGFVESPLCSFGPDPHGASPASGIVYGSAMRPVVVNRTWSHLIAASRTKKIKQHDLT